MWRRMLKVTAIGYAVKTVLFLGVWLAAPDLVRQGRDKVLNAWAGLTRTATPAAAAIAPAAPNLTPGTAVAAPQAPPPALPR